MEIAIPGRSANQLADDQLPAELVSQLRQALATTRYGNIEIQVDDGEPTFLTVRIRTKLSSRRRTTP